MGERQWLVIAAAWGLVAVAAGAFGAHGLEAAGDVRGAGLIETGSRYLMWHALAMLGCLALRRPFGPALWLWAGGSALFAFSLYALALGAPRAVAFVTPLGGAALVLGWVALAWGALKVRE